MSDGYVYPKQKNWEAHNKLTNKANSLVKVKKYLRAIFIFLVLTSTTLVLGILLCSYNSSSSSEEGQ